ncbi:hypothetical protein DFJ58DRAFT_847119 [Suillus subalutaceus]|uniref:uncharacterized protein n=1 Tax=Suillus subalutaceus TaxID=48586 RepID=UPI001B864AE5|nr:uncharacterized protein DFJ58DRAFT_847119 [Suillus subalutaceus]KAG1836177.1 hypothetical protein DFJ58DRAFT_847119 [Suillus subalutaceus]
MLTGLGNSTKTWPKKAKASLPTGDTLTSEERVPNDNSVTASSPAVPKEEDTLLSDKPDEPNNGVELVLTDSEVEEESAKDELREAEKANIHWSTLGGMRKARDKAKAREQRRYRRAKRGKVARRKAELGESGMRAIVRW